MTCNKAVLLWPWGKHSYLLRSNSYPEFCILWSNTPTKTSELFEDIPPYPVIVASFSRDPEKWRKPKCNSVQPFTSKVHAIHNIPGFILPVNSKELCSFYLVCCGSAAIHLMCDPILGQNFHTPRRLRKLASSLLRLDLDGPCFYLYN